MRAAVLSLLLASVVSAETRWMVMRSSNFEVFSSAGERATRDTLQHFEQVRGFFQQATGKEIETPFLIRVVIFSSRKDFEKVRPNDFVAAFYQPGAEREYIVMGNTATDVFPIAVHEYVHLLARQGDQKLPPWLNEGLAELYSTLEPRGKQILIGKVIQGRWQALQVEKWVPIQTILAATHDSPYYNEKNKASSLYNEGWALAHMLMLSDPYRAKSSKLLDAVQAGIPSDQALSAVYGKSVAEIEKDLLKYLRGSSVQGVLFDAKLEKLGERPEPQAVSDFDVKLVMAELGNRDANRAESRAAFEQLRAEDPKRPEPHAMLGYLAWREGGRKEAAESFAKAYALGDRNPKLLWDYGRLAQGYDDRAAAVVLTELLAAQPGRSDVRLELASAHLRSSDGAGAVQALAPMKKIPPDLAVRYFELAAMANAMQGSREQALAAARRMADYAKQPDEQERASRLLAGLTQESTLAYTPVPTDAPPADDQPRPTPPRTARQPSEQTPEPSHARPVRPSVRGQLVLMDCSGPAPRLTLKDGATRRILKIDQPNQVELIGTGTGPIELTCGPQNGRNVRIEYELPDPPSPGLTGLVRLIEYLP